MRPEQTRTYNRASSVVFLKTDAPFGGLSNMAGGYPLRVNGIRILTSEALYQACRFPHRPEVQTLIIEQKSPMTAKMKGKPHQHDSRPDWDQVRVKLMRWCLRVKLAQNWRAFSELLLETGERPIVEESRKDDFWGAKATEDRTLVGMNVLGRLLMELREAVKVEGRESLMRVQPLAIPDFLLGGRQIEAVGSQAIECDGESGTAAAAHARGETQGPTVKQPSLFDAPAVTEAPPAAYLAVSTKGLRVADLKPYSEYKESGLPWLGRVPIHWSVTRIKTVLRETDQRSEDGVETLLSLTRVRGLIPHRDMTDKMHSAKTLAGYKRYRAGQLVMNRMQAWSGMFGVGEIDGLVSPDYAVFDVLGGHAIKLVLERLKTPDLVGQFALESKGIGSGFNRLYTDRFGPIPISLPPSDEQAAIVRFLDWANGRLERAIRAKRKVIALLNEQKQAIIHRAVTRGLDPSVPLRPSGIPWLGEIPQHWEVRKLKHLTRFVNGLPFKPGDWKAVGVPIIRIQNLNGSEAFNYTDRMDLPAGLLIQPGDLMFAWSGNRGTSFGSFEWERKFPGFLNQHIFKLVGYTLPKRYFYYLLRAVTRHVEEQAGGIIGLVHVTKPELGSVQVPLAPPAEAEAIAQSIDKATTGIDRAISRLEREIALLREYRTRLAADVVTGKLDVREAAAQLPDEAPIESVEDDADLDDEAETADEETAV